MLTSVVFNWSCLMDSGLDLPCESRYYSGGFKWPWQIVSVSFAPVLERISSDHPLQIQQQRINTEKGPWCLMVGKCPFLILFGNFEHYLQVSDYIPKLGDVWWCYDIYQPTPTPTPFLWTGWFVDPSLSLRYSNTQKVVWHVRKHFSVLPQQQWQSIPMKSWRPVESCCLWIHIMNSYDLLTNCSI